MDDFWRVNAATAAFSVTHTARLIFWIVLQLLEKILNYPGITNKNFVEETNCCILVVVWVRLRRIIKLFNSSEVEPRRAAVPYWEDATSADKQTAEDNRQKKAFCYRRLRHFQPAPARFSSFLFLCFRWRVWESGFRFYRSCFGLLMQFQLWQLASKCIAINSGSEDLNWKWRHVRLEVMSVSRNIIDTFWWLSSVSIAVWFVCWTDPYPSGLIQLIQNPDNRMM